MRAVVQPMLGNSLRLSGSARRTPWYVPDRRIRTQAAARRAAELAVWSTSGRGLTAEHDEQALFIALHTCAFRAARCARGKCIAAGERESWSSRWRGIRECIVKRNLGLAYSMLSRIHSTDPDQDDRISEAMYGLVRAVERFNPWKGYRFSTYACNVIARALMRRSRHERRYRGLFPVQQGVYPECPSQPFDSRIGLWVERLNQAVQANSAGLTDLEARIIAHRFPRRAGPVVTLRQTGNAVGLSKERVRQIQYVALNKLRTILEVDPILQ